MRGRIIDQFAVDAAEARGHSGPAPMTDGTKRPAKAAEHAMRAVELLAYGEQRLTDAATALENALAEVHEARKDMRVRATAASVIRDETDLDLAGAAALYQRVELAVAVEREREQ